MLQFAAVIVAFLLITPSVKAQKGSDKSNLYIWGWTTNEAGKKISGVNIKVYSGISMLTQLTTPENGKFSFNLDFDSDYRLVFTKDDMATKIVAVDTKNVPEKERKWGYEHGPFKLKMIPEYDDIDYTILAQPIAKISYNKLENWFDVDKQYTGKIQRALADFERNVEDAREEKEIRAKEADDDYQLAINDADLFFEEKDYENAAFQYQAALRLKPSESYPKSQLDKIENLLDASRSDDEKYIAMLDMGELSIETEDWLEGKRYFEQASSIKPEETYPKEQVAMINAKLAELAQLQADADLAAQLAKESEKNYKKAVSKAQRLEADNDYDGAIAAWEEALIIREDAEEPGLEISRIENLLVEINANYDALIAEADGMYGAEAYSDALEKYKAAKEIKNTPYTQNQIEFINTKLKTEADAQAAAALAAADAAKKEERYTKFMALAAELEEEGKFNESIEKYNQAAVLFPDRTEPVSGAEGVRQKIADNEQAEIAKREALIAERKREEAYQQALSEGNSAFTVGDREEALEAYKTALEIKPEESYPQQRIEEIEKQLADEAGELAAQEAAEAAEQAKLKAFDEAMAAGNDFFEEGNLNDAKAMFLEAAALYPEDQSAKTRLNEINKLVEEQRKLDEYNAKNDTEFNFQLAKDYPQGKTESTEEKGDKTVTTIIIVEGERGDEYTKEVYSFGKTFYLKNKKPYAERNWIRETK